MLTLLEGGGFAVHLPAMPDPDVATPGGHIYFPS